MAFLRSLYAARPLGAWRWGHVDAAGGRHGNAHKTMAETMEDMLLEADSAAVAVDDSGDGDAIDIGGQPLKPAAAEEVADFCEQGITVAQPTTGALRPTIIIGLGSFGRKALLELRCRFLDRFGDLSKVPILRFLCIETDPEAVNVAVARRSGSGADAERGVPAAVAAGAAIIAAGRWNH